MYIVLQIAPINHVAQPSSVERTFVSSCLQMAAAAAAAAVVREAAASAVMDALEGESEEEKSSKMAAAKEDKMRKVIRWKPGP